MNLEQYFPEREWSGYLDSNGEKVYIGDTIDFTWWSYPGTEIETHLIGSIRRVQGHLVFHFKTSDGRYSDRRLSALNFDSQADWTLIEEKRGAWNIGHVQGQGIRYDGITYDENGTLTIHGMSNYDATRLYLALTGRKVDYIQPRANGQAYLSKTAFLKGFTVGETKAVAFHSNRDANNWRSIACHLQQLFGCGFQIFHKGELLTIKRYK